MNPVFPDDDDPVINGIRLIDVTREGRVKVELQYEGHANVVEMRADDLVSSGALAEATGAFITPAADEQLRSAVLPDVPIKLFRRFSAELLNNMEFPEVQWVLADLLPAGLTVFAGKPKVGKSWWAMGQAVEIAQTGDVLYLALEDPPRRLQDRMRKVLDGREAPRLLRFETDWARLDQGGLDELREWLRGHPFARAVFIDTIAKVRPPRGVSEDQYLGDYGVWGPLQALTIDHPSVGIIGVHHQRKGADEDVVATVLGSQGVTGVADNICILKKSRGQTDGELYVVGRDVEERERALNFEGGRWTDVGDAAEFRVSTERSEVVALLTVEGPQTATEVARKLGIKFHTAYQRLRRAVEAGEVVKLGDQYTVVH
jgi:hypothetical protein